MEVRRIAIVGISGSGKTALGRRLAQSTGLILHPMDALFWRGAWQATPETEYLAAHGCLVAQPEWIIEGYIDCTMAERVRRADLIIDLDIPGPLCAWRVFARWLRHRRRARPELPPEAVERLSLKYLWTVFTCAERPAVDAALAGVDPGRIRRVRAPGDLQRLNGTLGEEPVVD